ncbi:MAG: CRISPR-associated helicase Cas3' [Sandaracinaceae bacterium]|nr:CRISPR-associated helicase Cas3' [Sandaracinaceae bacterium]
MAWHPLEAHCADVAACCEALLRDTLLGARLAHLFGGASLHPVVRDRLVVIAALHDLGKYSICFQNRAFRVRLPQGGHVAPIVKGLSSSGRVFDQLLDVLAPLASFGSAWGPYLAASISHHGRPERIGDATGFDPAWFEAAHGLDPVDGMRRLMRAVERWYPNAFDTAIPDLELPDQPAAQHFFAGLVMLADWLGSDARVFEYAQDTSDPMPLARERAARVVQARFLAPAGLRAACRADYEVFSTPDAVFVPRPAQCVVSELPIPSVGEATLTVLEAETGSGKTEAALHRYAQLFRAGLVDGIYFALPTRTSATQIHQRVVRAVASTFEALSPEARPPVVLAVPGYLRVDDVSGQALPNFNVQWPDVGTNRDRTWATEHAKRYLAGSVVVGTIDQALLSTLVVDHAHLRATSLSRLLLVVDEVHASDAYMTKLLDQVLAFHFACGGHAFLMSATLGTTEQRGFMARATAPRALAPLPKRPPLALAESIGAPYPAIHHGGTRTKPSTVPALTPGNAKTCAIELWPAIDDAESVAERALDAARRGAQVLVLRNTVADAVATQRALEDLVTTADHGSLFRVRGVATVHHARFVQGDRRLLDEAVEARLGKHADRSVGSVVVATQTVQQSLDLDADLLITDLCPMDVLLQRIGRVHRHARPASARPEGFRAATCVVLDPGSMVAFIDARGVARGQHGYGRVYEDMRILEATRDLMVERDVLEVPEDNRMLVERATHPEALAAVVERCGPAMVAHAMTSTGARFAKVQLADGHVVQRTTEMGSYGFPDRDTVRRVATRLGAEDRLLEFEQGFDSAFGTHVRSVKVPHWLAQGWPATVSGRVSSLSDGVVTFDALDAEGGRLATFHYDRLGLHAGAPEASTVHQDTTEAEADE